MKTLPEQRYKAVFGDKSSVIGFVACFASAMCAALTLTAYFASTYFPEINGFTPLVWGILGGTAALLGFLFNSDRYMLPIFGLLTGGIVFFFPESGWNALYIKLQTIMHEIYKYSPDYTVTGGWRYDSEYTLFCSVLALWLGIVLVNRMLRCKVLAPTLVTAICAFCVFISNERTEGGYFYSAAMCIFAFIIIGVQTKCLTDAGETVPVTRLGIKTAAFVLACVLVLVPVLNSKETANALKDKFSSFTGLGLPVGTENSESDLSEASGEPSGDQSTPPAKDPNQPYNQTNMTDIHRTGDELFRVYGQSTKHLGTLEESLYLRSTVYYKYNTFGNGWSDPESTMTMLFDHSVETLFYDKQMVLESFPHVQITEWDLKVMEGENSTNSPVPTGAISHGYKVGTTWSQDTSFTAYVLSDYGSQDDRNDIFDLYEIKGGNNIYSADTYTGSIGVDNELKELADYIMTAYSDYENLEDWKVKSKNYGDAIKAVRDYLMETKRYTVTPTQSESYENYDRSKSGVYNFLFNTGEGYCVHFATSAALLLRVMGVETRYAVGYVAESGSGLREDDTYFNRSVTDENTHAWCEVNMDNLGWIPFEMTFGAGTREEAGPPTVGIPSEFETSDSSEDASEETSDQSEETSDQSEEISDESEQTSEESQNPGGVSSNPVNIKAILYCILTVLCVIIGLWLAALVVRRAAMRRENTQKRTELYAAGLGDPKEGVLEIHDRHIKLLALVKLAPAPAQGYDEFAAELAKKDQAFADAVRVIDIFAKAEFGGTPDKAELITAAQHIDKVNRYVYENSKGLYKLKGMFKGYLTNPKREE